MWIAFLIASIVFLSGAVIFAIITAKSKYKSGRILDPSKILFVGVILSAVSLLIPMCHTLNRGSSCGHIETFLVSVHNMIRLFVVDGEFDFVLQTLPHDLGYGISRGYTLMFSVLYLLAPILTFGFVLSFFKNVSAYKRYITHYNSDAYIFSELNDKTLALAQSLYKNHRKSMVIVFTKVFEKSEKQSSELVEKAKELGAICFKKDILTVDFSIHRKKSSIYFFAADNNMSDNVSTALKLIDKVKYRDNTRLYVFSSDVESDILLENAFGDCGREDGAEEKKILLKVRRVNEVRSLINRTLYEDGYEKIFCSARPDENGIKKINALIVGMGLHGVEMTRALSWFCQMDGYEADIHSFDMDTAAEDKFTSLCPELMKFSGKTDIPGESKYTITVHSGTDVTTDSFDRLIMSLPLPTYVFIALGNDAINISTAVKLRSLCERRSCKAVIQAVVYDSEKKEALNDIKNFKNTPYNIDFIGDIEHSFTEEVILNSDVEARALERHLKWGNEEDFWRFGYNYKSSIASAIHRKMKKLCGIPGADKEPALRTEEELWNLRILEHCRWNTYMRSEGYVYSGSLEKESRNDLAKTHNCLVPFDELPLYEQEKDDN